MPLREFTDEKGHVWRVWDTVPASTTLRAEFVHGWLTFEQGMRRRRLAPIPPGWATLGDGELRRLCEQAVPEQPRKRLIE